MLAIDGDGACEVIELPAHAADEMANLKISFRMIFVDDEGLGSERAGGDQDSGDDVENEPHGLLLLFLERLTHMVQRTDQVRQLQFVDTVKCLRRGVADRLIELPDQSTAGGGDAAVDAAKVIGFAPPLDELLPFEAIKQPSDSRRLLDHARGDLQRRQSFRLRAPENA